MKKKFRGVFLQKATDKSSLEGNIDNVLRQLKCTLLHKLDISLSQKILYWLNDWSASYLIEEKQFCYTDLIKYEYGTIVQVDLGFKIGSEQGGLHYAIIIDKDNKKSSPVLMVIPLKSLDIGMSEQDIDSSVEVYLGNDLFSDELARQNIKYKVIEEKLNETGSTDPLLLREKANILKDINNFKRGTVAQVSQTCALSKIRVYYPTTTSDKLYGLKVTPKQMMKLEEKFKELFF